MAASTLAALTALYKRLYMSRNLVNLALRETPLFRVISKYNDLTGEGIYIPINYALPVGSSASFAVAKANAKSSSVDKWFLQRKRYYGFVTLDMESVYASKGKESAFLELKRKEADEAIDYIGRNIGASFWGDGSGAIGQTSTAVTGATDTATLVQLYDAVNFHLKQRLQANPNRTGNSGTLRTDKYEVTAINRDTGVITLSRYSGAADDWGINDYLYVEGDYDARITGVNAYIPASTPGTLNGMTRTDDPQAKGGWRGTDEGTIEESAKLLCARMGQYMNKAASALWLSTINWFRLEQELSSQNRKVMDPTATGYFGTPALVLLTPKGSVPVMADPFCPNDTGYLLDHSTWEIHHMEGLPHIVMDDGLTMLRMADEDSGEIRFRAWCEAVCTRPFSNGRFPIS
jgi:hypothetical protein